MDRMGECHGYHIRVAGQEPSRCFRATRRRGPDDTTRCLARRERRREIVFRSGRALSYRMSRSGAPTVPRRLFREDQHVHLRDRECEEADRFTFSALRHFSATGGAGAVAPFTPDLSAALGAVSGTGLEEPFALSLAIRTGTHCQELAQHTDHTHGRAPSTCRVRHMLVPPSSGLSQSPDSVADS